MYNRISRLSALLLISAVLTALLGGCVSTSGSTATTSPGEGTPPGPAQTLTGAVQLPKASAASKGGIPVRLRAADGTLIDATTTTPEGGFVLHGGVDGRVEASLPAGGTLAAEVRQAAPGYVWINIPTTMISRYARANPGVPLADIEARVKASLNIPARISIRGGLGDSWRSFFSPTAFAQAAGATPLDVAIDQAVNRAESGAVRGFRIPHPYPTLFRSLHPREADLYAIYVPVDDLTAAALPGEGEGASFWAGVAQGMVGNYITGGSKIAFGWATCSLGFGFTASGNATAKEYALINQDLAALQASINALSVQTTTLAGVTACQAPVSRLQANWTNFNTYLQNNDTQSAAALLQNYVGSNQLAADLDTLSNNLLGSPGLVTPMVPNYAAMVDAADFGSTSPSGTYLFMDIRTNDALDDVGQVADFYQGWMQVGGCMQAEWSHLDPNSFPVVGQGTPNSFSSHIALGQVNINGAPAVTGWAADLISAQQLNAPPTIGSDDVMADLSTATLYYLPVFAPVAEKDVLPDAASFSLGPWPAGPYGSGWLLMSYAQCARLSDIASNLGGSNGVNYGLAKLGVIAGYPNNYTTDHIITWFMNPYGYTGQYDLTANKEKTTASGTFNYILVRGLPGPSEDPGTLLATVSPTSITASAASGLLGCQGVFPAVSAAYNNYYGTSLATANQNLTPYVTWGSSNPSDFSIANYGPTSDNPVGWWGTVFFHTNAPSGTASASLCTGLSSTPGSLLVQRLLLPLASVSAPSLGTASAPVLTSMLVSPNVVNYPNAQGGYQSVVVNGNTTLLVNCIATGFYSDGSVKDLTGQVTWSVTSTTGIAAFSVGVPNQLNLSETEGSDQVTITATYNGPDAPAPMAASGAVTTSFP